MAMHNTQHGTVTLKTEMCKGGCLFTVKDTGEHLNDKKIELMMSPFSRESEASVRVEGLGLGLSLVKRILETIGGNITVSSSDSGSHYPVFIPSLDFGQNKNISM